MPWSAVSGGGGSSTSDSYALIDSLGQSGLQGLSTTPGFVLTAGFIYGLPEKRDQR